MKNLAPFVLCLLISAPAWSGVVEEGGGQKTIIEIRMKTFEAVEACAASGWFDATCTQADGDAGICSVPEVSAGAPWPTDTCNTGLINSGRCRSEFEGDEVPEKAACQAFLASLLVARFEGTVRSMRNSGQRAIAANASSLPDQTEPLDN